MVGYGAYSGGQGIDVSGVVSRDRHRGSRSALLGRQAVNEAERQAERDRQDERRMGDLESQSGVND